MKGPTSSGSDEATLRSWVESRTPPVPQDFQPHLELADPARPGATATDRVDGLAEETRLALARAAGRDAADRAGAFDLLAADAWATWASEAALETSDPVATLTQLAIRLSTSAR